MREIWLRLMYDIRSLLEDLDDRVRSQGGILFAVKARVNAFIFALQNRGRKFRLFVLAALVFFLVMGTAAGFFGAGIVSIFTTLYSDFFLLSPPHDPQLVRELEDEIEGVSEYDEGLV